MAGGALFNHLDYSFAAGNESGNYNYDTTTPGGGSDVLRKQLAYLKKFIEGFDFTRMAPDTNFFSDPAIRGNALAEQGKQYAAYFINENKVADISMNVRSGRYRVSWIDPQTGKYEKSFYVTSKNGSVTLKVPTQSADLAFKMIAR